MCDEYNYCTVLTCVTLFVFVGCCLDQVHTVLA